METKGISLEEIDALFDGHKHSDVPDVELVRRGQATLDIAGIEQELDTQIVVETKAA